MQSPEFICSDQVFPFPVCVRRNPSLFLPKSWWKLLKLYRLNYCVVMTKDLRGNIVKTFNLRFLLDFSHQNVHTTQLLCE